MKFSMEFVVYMSFRISDGYLKYVDSCDQLFLQEAIEAGYFFPHSAQSSSAESAKSSVSALYTNFRSAIKGFKSLWK